jgi:hypothetical protein
MIYDSESEFNDGSSMDPAFLQGTAIKARYVRFDRFCIDQHRQQVSRNGARIRLQGKVYQVLIVLLQKQGEVVTREELKQALWSAHASRGGRCHLLDLSLCSPLGPPPGANRPPADGETGDQEPDFVTLKIANL